ncbi:hypothetical protein C8A05DRAFT_14745 [Staphylotrichum tortipilum]|uniref:Formylmethionine deformylase-like protein n=1 Tax=Staphylotrichum tortipilum TaxID=2831512 RepID=A0AAN6MN30_9PEZI|nr:hypothetical protein C8A05DRAFT_14745 [Staphylotrichum longicolle]
MDHNSLAQPDPDYYDPYLQHAEPEVDAWSPLAPTPDLGASSPTPPQRARVAFAPASPPSGTGTGTGTNIGADTPSSVGLGIGSTDHDVQFPGYHPVVSRDSFQQDSRPTTPPLPNDMAKSTLSPQEYPLSSPYGAAFYYPQNYGTDSPPPGPSGSGRLAGLTQSTGWRLLSGGWPMYSMFLLGFAFAVGHHGFYLYLHEKPAEDPASQIFNTRIGGFFSYAAKASLLSAVFFAYRQQIWVTAISNVLQLKTIDSLFAAIDEPLALWNWEFIKKAKVAACLAVLAWLFPLTVILTPATLTVAPLTEVREEMCHGVRTLNFEQEMEKNWRDKVVIDGRRIVSLSLWSSTVTNSSGMTNMPFNETFFDYWATSSFPLTLIAERSAFSRSVIPREDIVLDICGGGWNCSYTISFKAPGYKCTEVARNRALDGDALIREKSALINATNLIPIGDFSYIVDSTTSTYAQPQLREENTTADGAPLMEPPYPKHLGAFRTEPAIWLGYSVQTGTGTPLANRKDPGWDTAFEAVLTSCDHYLVNYTVQFNHTSTAQITTVLKRDYLHKIIDTTYVPGKDAMDGTMDNTTAVPESNYVYPTDFERYRLIAAYHSLGQQLRSLVVDSVQYLPSPMPKTAATKIGLIDIETYLAQPNTPTMIQHIYENMTLSLLSNPSLAIVTWAANNSQTSGWVKTTDPALAYPCVRTRVGNAYFYNRRDLWIAYAVAIGATVFAVVLGSAALGQNNYHVRDVHVSSVVAATRAPCLDELPWKASKWGEVPDEILRTRLGYGVVAEPGPNGTPAATATGTWTGGAGSPVVIGGRVYYGFAPREVLERTRVARVATFGPGRPKTRLSAFSFRTWEQHY